MSEKTGIQWTDHTFNPWWGCVKVSEACKNCYAEALANRYGHAVWGADAPRRFFGEKHWQEPCRWNRAAADAGVRGRVFCASMADVFEDWGVGDVLDAERGRLFGLIEATPMLDWLLLTKRPENIARMLPADWLSRERPNVWFGTTVENQERADERIPHLLRVPARVRFLSIEPMLGPIKFKIHHWPIHWVIAGGESGSKHRPSDPAWFRALRDQCINAGVPFFFKQWGGFHPKANGAELDGREWKEFP